MIHEYAANGNYFRQKSLFTRYLLKIFATSPKSNLMLPSGSSQKYVSKHDVASVSKPDTGPGAFLASAPAKKSQVKVKASSPACTTKAVKMKKKAKVKFVVTDAQLDKLAGILCDLLHKETVPAVANSRESLTALLA